MVPSRLPFLLPVLLVLASCGEKPVGPPPLAEAYAGPATLPLRQDISLRSAITGMAKHGDHLDILEVKRRFVKVRTPQGQQGWADAHLLMSTQQMDELRQLTVRAVKMPSEGTAAVIEAVNMHTEANRLSASFYQLAEKAQVQVVDRKVTPRIQPAPPGFTFTRSTLARRGSKRKPAPLDLPPPSAPKPPANWVELSQTPKIKEVDNAEGVDKENERKRKARAKDAPAVDDWSLVRVKEGKAGWVLSRMINMAIPDEVAQYAEGHRITSFFPLGQIQDEEKGLKKHWVWTTMVGVRNDCDFDSFRIFIWNRRHHRYETAYIEKRILGRYPVEANIDGKTGTFAVITQDENGKWLRRMFVLEGYQVHGLGEEPYVPGQTLLAANKASQEAGTSAKTSWFASIRQKISKMLGR